MGFQAHAFSPVVVCHTSPHGAENMWAENTAGRRGGESECVASDPPSPASSYHMPAWIFIPSSPRVIFHSILHSCIWFISPTPSYDLSLPPPTAVLSPTALDLLTHPKVSCHSRYS